MSESPDPHSCLLVRLTPDDTQRCEQISAAAGWNQTVEDWRFHIETGEGIGLETKTGELIATGVVLPAARDVGWVAMILVREDWRRQGLGLRIMTRLVEDSRYGNLALDATDFGQTLYERLGFKPLETIVRFRLVRDGPVVCPEAIGRDEAAAFDDNMANKLSRRDDVTIVSHATALGLVRPGRTAVHAGPVTARSEKDAASLVEQLLEKTNGTVIIDVPARTGTFGRRLERTGFTPTRSFTRMSRGGPCFVSPGTFAITGPEYG